MLLNYNRVMLFTAGTLTLNWYDAFEFLSTLNFTSKLLALSDKVRRESLKMLLSFDFSRLIEPLEALYFFSKLWLRRYNCTVFWRWAFRKNWNSMECLINWILYPLKLYASHKILLYLIFKLDLAIYFFETLGIVRWAFYWTWGIIVTYWTFLVPESGRYSSALIVWPVIDAICEMWWCRKAFLC